MEFYEPFSPMYGQQEGLTSNFVDYTFDDKKDVDDYISFSSDVRDFFGTLIEYEYKKSEAGYFMNDAVAEEVIEQCDEFMKEKEEELDKALEGLRQGMFAPSNRGKKIEKTEEGIDISNNLLAKGFVADEEIERFPGVVHKLGIHPVMECTQNIPCNPCQDACPKKCIKIGLKITSLPAVDESVDCIGCGMCVASCPGQAIFLVNENVGEGMAEITLPYEIYPLPEVGEKGIALSRAGHPLCIAEVTKVRTGLAFDKTAVLTIRVPKEFAMKARFYKNEKLAKSV
jgi:Fe-S-cluster-containing hydrogenase component 2